MTTDHQGVLAFGDSITNGGGELQWGVALQSWVQWIARALGLPFTNYATDGARARDVTERQITAHRHLNAAEAPRYQLGCLYVGVNDVRSPDWEPAAYEQHLATALNYLIERCDTVITLTIPHDLGRPQAGLPVLIANRIITEQADRTDALLLDLSSFKGREYVMFDHVHLTAMGQIELAERVISLLQTQGWVPRVRPQALAAPDDGPRQRLRASLVYAYRATKQQLRIIFTLSRQRLATYRSPG